MSLGIRGSAVVGVEGHVDALLEIARWMAELIDNDPASREGLFLHGLSIGIRLRGMATEVECLGIERGALLRRHGQQTSLDEIVAQDEIVTENVRQILSGAA